MEVHGLNEKENKTTCRVFVAKYIIIDGHIFIFITASVILWGAE